MRVYYNKYIFYISVMVLVIIFIYNKLTGNIGSYVNYSKLLWIEALKELNIEGGGKKDLYKTTKESHGELECRRVVELLTNEKFSKARPSFLKNNITNGNLELDCYSPILKLGIEYNGKQHYEYTPYFHSSKDSFYNMKYRDEMKARLCEENGIKLIIVPYTIPVEKIENYIKQKLHELKVI